MPRNISRIARLIAAGFFVASPAALQMHAQDRPVPAVAAPIIEERPVGPYDVHVLAGGPALQRPIPAASRVLTASSGYTLSLWVKMSTDVPQTTLLAGIGTPAAENSRYLGLLQGKPVLRYGADNLLTATALLPATGWHFLAATSDGSTEVLYVDGVETARGQLASAEVAPTLTIAPAFSRTATQTGKLTGMPGAEHFSGDIAAVLLLPDAVSPATLRDAAQHPPQPAMLHWLDASLSWPVQTRGQAGMLELQDPSLLPVGRAPLGKGVAKPPPAPGSSLQPVGQDAWLLRRNWRLAAAPEVNADGAQLSIPGYADKSWMAATVPGTVLTTMVDRGIYPDPDFGLNNLAIPESLNKQDYWYRIDFPTPAGAAGHHAALTFQGINYAAEVWLDGQRLGTTKGAFLRGEFGVGTLLKPGAQNALAVRISPPPHPGIPQEESVKAGPGDNGGTMCLDGPTFVATEGWDWIPSIRDRDTGIWQDVELRLTDTVLLGDAKVVTHLPLPDTTTADVTIDVPVRNQSDAPVSATVDAAFEGVTLHRTVQLTPGSSVVHFDPTTNPELRLRQPRLWWPNGYGKPELYHLKLTATVDGHPSDRRELTFGVREISYELSLFDSTGHLRRVEALPTIALAQHADLVDVRHEAMRQTAEYWAPSLTAAGEHSPAVKAVTDEPGFTDLVLKVNGVRIAARGGNWGMDDSRKRVSREHLEPFFRLHRDANINIIRNWVGQNTEEVFYQLADEYGIMVWNDFWASTQNYNLEPQDVPLFLSNARDTVRHFRNHPSIVVWCGRNEGVPQPILNEGLIDLLREEDGTRYYTPGSNRIDLRDSGPYHYQDPADYYRINQGFSVELGITSLSTLESLRASIAPADQWPLGDALAYHDWHANGNGDIHYTTRHLEQQFGAGTSLEDFERKAQMFNYVDHRAIFEGFNQHLWAPNSGRMLWMTQPAWPSNSWQILSSDYDTQASYYGVQKACEPLHIQLDLTDGTVTAVNTTGAAAPGLRVQATVYSLDGKPFAQQQGALDLQANSTHNLFALTLPSLYAQSPVVLVELRMTDSAGKLISRNVYWLAAKEDDYRQMNAMAPAALTVTAVPSAAAAPEGERALTLHLTNSTATPVIAAKLTLLDRKSKERILPAYYSDNYVSLLPGESADVTIRYPAAAARGDVAIGLRGWNVTPSTRNVSAR